MFRFSFGGKRKSIKETDSTGAGVRCDPYYGDLQVPGRQGGQHSQGKGHRRNMSTTSNTSNGSAYDIPVFGDVHYSDHVFMPTSPSLQPVDQQTSVEHISDREDLETHEMLVKEELIPKSASSSPLPVRTPTRERSDDTPDTPRSRRSSVNPSFNGANGLRRSNSTSTLFVDSTVSKPNREDTLACVALAIHYIILDGHQQEDPQLLSDAFDERRFPLTEMEVPDTYAADIPTDVDVYDFMDMLFDAAALSAECGIVALVYINRCIQYTNIAMHASNWKRILLGGIIMASKVWDDQAVWNVDFVGILPAIKVEDLNDLERTFLEMLQFNINVDSSVYAKYYFELRKLAEEADRPFPLEPLSKERAALLDASAKHVKDALTARSLRGSKSMGHEEFTSHAVLP